MSRIKLVLAFDLLPNVTPLRPRLCPDVITRVGGNNVLQTLIRRSAFRVHGIRTNKKIHFSCLCARNPCPRRPVIRFCLIPPRFGDRWMRFSLGLFYGDGCEGRICEGKVFLDVYTCHVEWVSNLSFYFILEARVSFIALSMLENLWIECIADFESSKLSSTERGQDLDGCPIFGYPIWYASLLD